MASEHYGHTLQEALYSLVPQRTVWKDALSSPAPPPALNWPQASNNIQQQMHKVLV